MVPYLMSSHPGSSLADALELALELKENGYSPEQVQDFYPTPGTASTVMFYTGINPFTGKSIYVADYEEKQLQRALLQYGRPENADKVRTALKRLGRTDLIGHTKDCLVRPERQNSAPRKPKTEDKSKKENSTKKQSVTGTKKPAGWAKSTPKNAKGTRKPKPQKNGKKR